MMRVIDLRSDTVTVPDENMRKVIYEAPVGDSGYGDDPSINALEALAAEMTGQESSLFLPSGIMGNVVAVLTHCNRGEAALVGNRCHIYRYEGGGLAALAGILPYPLCDDEGIPSPEDIIKACPAVDVHFAQARLLCLENTHNDCGGMAVSPERFEASVKAGREKNLKIHLDGARIFNASVAWGVDVKRYTSIVDSVQFCLSKGLGAPMGSMLCGSSKFIEVARFHRKRIGGELRQAGFMGAAGVYALKNNVSRLADDHANAKLLGEMLEQCGIEGLSVEKNPDPTNMVYFSLGEGLPNALELVKACAARGLLFNDMGERRIRLVTHIQVEKEDIPQVVDVICGELRRA